MGDDATAWGQGDYPPSCTGEGSSRSEDTTEYEEVASRQIVRVVGIPKYKTETVEGTGLPFKELELVQNVVD